jgi:hypothetical protein
MKICINGISSSHKASSSDSKNPSNHRTIYVNHPGIHRDLSRFPLTEEHDAVSNFTAPAFQRSRRARTHQSPDRPLNSVCAPKEEGCKLHACTQTKPLPFSLPPKMTLESKYYSHLHRMPLRKPPKPTVVAPHYLISLHHNRSNPLPIYANPQTLSP